MELNKINTPTIAPTGPAELQPITPTDTVSKTNASHRFSDKRETILGIGFRAGPASIGHFII